MLDHSSLRYPSRSGNLKTLKKRISNISHFCVSVCSDMSELFFSRSNMKNLLKMRELFSFEIQIFLREYSVNFSRYFFQKIGF